jgi:hypothetical protein
MERGQSSLSSRDSERSASSRPPVWQVRAVVALVLGVDDPLHRRAADRHGSLKRPWTAISIAEGGDFLGKAAAGFARAALDPRSSVARVAS